MGCLLVARGSELDIDRMVEALSIDLDSGHTEIFRRGEPTLPNTQPDGKTHEKSGVVIRVRDAGFDEFDAQIQDAIELLEDDRELFRNIVSFQGVEEAVLSFGINWQNTYTHTDHLPAALIRLAGEIGLDLEIVHMPVRPSPPTQSEATVE